MNFKRFSFYFASIFTIGFTSCVSTDTIEPNSHQDEPESIVLNISSPSGDYTRAEVDHSGYKLRYSAILYTGKHNNLPETIADRQEIIEGDISADGTENQIIFKAPAGDYTIFVYADYIPESYEKDGKEYKDYFYDTHSDKSTRVRMLRTPGNTNTNELSEDFFNNDNYDFFSGIIIGEKKDGIREDKTLKLTRSVAKVRVIDTSGYNESFDFSVSNFKSYVYFSRLLNSTTALQPDDASGYSFSFKNTPSLGNNNERELLFYYSPAMDVESSDIKNTFYLNFEGIDPEKYKNFSSQKVVGEAKIRNNYITTVKGKLLPIPLSDNTEGMNPEGDNIYLTIFSGEETQWTEQNHNWR